MCYLLCISIESLQSDDQFLQGQGKFTTMITLNLQVKLRISLIISSLPMYKYGISLNLLFLSEVLCGFKGRGFVFFFNINGHRIHNCPKLETSQICILAHELIAKWRFFIKWNTTQNEKNKLSGIYSHFFSGWRVKLIGWKASLAESRTGIPCCWERQKGAKNHLYFK